MTLWKILKLAMADRLSYLDRHLTLLEVISGIQHAQSVYGKMEVFWHQDIIATFDQGPDYPLMAGAVARVDVIHGRLVFRVRHIKSDIGGNDGE